MPDDNTRRPAQPDDEANESKQDSKPDYLKRAKEAKDSGDALLSMYLYLAAFQKALEGKDVPSEDALFGLKQAWALACTNKERSLAEYIFKLMEPYLTTEEMALCTDELQDLALDKLAEFGFSREELEDIAQMISEDLLNDGEPMVKVEHIVTKRALPEGKEEVPFTPEGEVNPPLSKEDMGAPEAEEAGEDETLPAAPPAFMADEEMLDYDNIAGYDGAIKIMRDFGIGMGDDENFQELIGLLNARHGLAKMPALDTMLFRAHVREDANRFMMATLGELSMPTVHMRMEENVQGVPVLCVSAHAVDIPPAGSLKDVFTNGGVLVLEDLDLWGTPVTEMGEDSAAFFMMQLTRGAREAVSMIRSAVDNPEVYVFATATIDGSIDEFFLEIMEPMSLIDIEYPTAEERMQIWLDIARNHPSIRTISKADLVRLSANMARYDIYMAAREAIEEAYKLGLMTRRYQPVTRDNLFDKLAAYQPLESTEYTELENEVIRDFQSDLNHIDDLLQND